MSNINRTRNHVFVYRPILGTNTHRNLNQASEDIEIRNIEEMVEEEGQY